MAENIVSWGAILLFVLLLSMIDKCSLKQQNDMYGYHNPIPDKVIESKILQLLENCGLKKNLETE